MTEEVLELIAKRIPPGDNWKLEIDQSTVIEGLVGTLTEYLKRTGFKGHYRLAPLDGKLYAIKEEETLPPEPEKFSIYGEY